MTSNCVPELKKGEWMGRGGELLGGKRKYRLIFSWSKGSRLLLSNSLLLSLYNIFVKMNKCKENFLHLKKILRASSFSHKRAHISCWHCLDFECRMNMFFLITNNILCKAKPLISVMTQADWNKTRLYHTISPGSKCLNIMTVPKS